MRNCSLPVQPLGVFIANIASFLHCISFIELLDLTGNELESAIPHSIWKLTNLSKLSPSAHLFVLLKMYSASKLTPVHLFKFLQR